jgi:hypothetical protein
MLIQRNAMTCLAAAAILMATPLSIDGTAQAQQYRGDKPVTGNPGGGGGSGGGPRGPGWGVIVPGLIMAIPHLVPPPQDREVYVDDQPRQPRRPPPQSTARRGPSGVPPANETRLVPDEVVIELRNTVRPQQIDAMQRRHRLTRLESQVNQLSGTTLYRWRIPDRRSVAQVVRELEANNLVTSAQPNYLYTLQQSEQKPAGDPAQYELAKLRLPEAHAFAQGEGVLVAVIDSGVDTDHDELKGSVADYFNALETPIAAHMHGTAIAALIAGHGKLLGAAPKAKILAIRAFDPKGASAEGTTFGILKGIDWAAAKNARIINMSFAGPDDPAIRRSLDAAFRKGIVLIAAAGNEGPTSPPLYPAANPNVIAVTATDAEDKLFAPSNRGRHIALASPGDQLLVATPDGYEVSSGTSYSAAGISGIVALMLERDGRLTPAKVRAILQSTARDLGPKGRDADFGAGLVDAVSALSASSAPVTASSGKRPVERVSTGTR